MDTQHIAKKTAHHFVVGISSNWSLLFFFIVTIFWLAVGIYQGFPESWQVILHITLAIITFIMVLLIQHAQHRETKSMQLKLDEILKGVEGSRNEFINIQTESDERLEELQRKTQRDKHSDIDREVVKTN